jgi:hypothetical protein
MIELRHTRLNERRMLEWLVVCEDRCTIPPSYPEICTAFQFPELTQAKTLIAQLSDAGMIHVRPAGEDRFSCQIITTVFKQSPAQKRSYGLGEDEEEEDEMAKKNRLVLIKQAARRLNERKQLSEGYQPERSPETNSPIIAPSQGGSGRNPALPEAVSEQLSIAGHKKYAPETPPIKESAAFKKPKIKAAVVRALNDDGRPFDEFLTYLVDLGLDVHLARLAQGINP